MRSLEGLLGDSALIHDLRIQVTRLLDRPQGTRRLPAVLITGETGVGKGLLARAMHDASDRRTAAFVAINCAAVPETLVEAELFGYERGAFTDARQAKPGLFQAAHRGSLFLDEIGTLPLALQAKLLTAIEERQVRRLGSTRPESVDVWILSASNDSLPAAVGAGRFRPDLYHRLSALTLELPPLRARAGDVLLLADHYLDRACRDYGLAPKHLTADARRALLAYAWPGNVRELINLLERTALLAGDDALTARDLGLPVERDAVSGGPRQGRAVSGESPDRSAPPSVLERDDLLGALEATKWNLSRAAARLNIPRNTLRYRMEKLRLRPSAEQRNEPAGDHESLAAHLTPQIRSPGQQSGDAPAPRQDHLRWERRIVAALRVEIVSSQGSSIEEAAPWLQSIVNRLKVLQAHIEELSPRSVVAAFGVVPVEDAPTLAVQTALSLVRWRERRQEESAPVIRCAIHVAEGLIARSFDTMGLDPADKRTISTTLEHLASEPGSELVVVSAAAARFLHGRFVMELLTSRSPTSVPGYSVVREGRVETQATTAFIGRDRDLTALDDLLGLAEAGQGQVIVIIGEPGVGKSRLVEEFRRALGHDRVTYLEGRCVSYGSSMPYLPLVQLLSHTFAILETDTPDAVRTKVQNGLAGLRLPVDANIPFLLYLLGIKEESAELAALSPEAIKQRTIEVLRQLTLAGSRRRPLVIAVEDLHWIDPSSEECLAALADMLAAARILLLATSRPGYQAPWLGRSYATQLVLRRLPASDSLALVQALTEGCSLSKGLLDTIVAHSDGVPFFIEELTRSVLDHPESDSRIEVPDTIQGVLNARLDRLLPEDRSLLQAAAILGKDIPVLLLRQLTDLPPAEVSLALRRLQAADFIVETNLEPVHEFTFKHALTQDVAYLSLVDEQRLELHARAATAIEELAPETRERRPELLAHHYTRAGLNQLAIAYWHLAGQRAVERSANAEAIQHLEAGLLLLEVLPESPLRLLQELTLRTALASPLVMLRGYGMPEVEQHLSRAHAICLELGPTAESAPVLFGLFRYHLVRAQYKRTQELASDMLRVAIAAADQSLHVVAAAMAGIPLFYNGEFLDARRHLIASLSIYDSRTHLYDNATFGQDPAVGAMSYLAWTLALLGQGRAASEHAQRSVEIARERRHPFTLAFALHSATLVHLIRHDAVAAARDAGEQLAISEEQAFPFWRGSALQFLGWVECRQSHTAAGLAKMREGLTLYRAAGVDIGSSICASFLAQALLEANQPAGAIEVVDEYVAFSARFGELAYHSDLLAIKAEALARLGAFDLALTMLQNAIALAEDQHTPVFALRGLLRLARIHPDGLVGDDRNRLRRLHQELAGHDDTPDIRAAGALLGLLH